MGTTDITVGTKAYRQLKEWADEREISIGTLIDPMIDNRQREIDFQNIRAQYAALQQRPEEWHAYVYDDPTAPYEDGASDDNVQD